jgi:hypothetical protein
MQRPARPEPRPENKAGAYFTALDIALSRGDYLAAAKAQQALAAIGWDIRRRHTKPVHADEAVTS